MVQVEPVLTPAEAAARLRLEESTVQAWCRQGRLGVKVGGRWRIAASEVAALLTRPAAPPAPPGARRRRPRAGAPDWRAELRGMGLL